MAAFTTKFTKDTKKWLYAPKALPVATIDRIQPVLPFSFFVSKSTLVDLSYQSLRESRF